MACVETTKMISLEGSGLGKNNYWKRADFVIPPRCELPLRKWVRVKTLPDKIEEAKKTMLKYGGLGIVGEEECYYEKGKDDFISPYARRKGIWKVYRTTLYYQ